MKATNEQHELMILSGFKLDGDFYIGHGMKVEFIENGFRSTPHAPQPLWVTPASTLETVVIRSPKESADSYFERLMDPNGMVARMERACGPQSIEAEYTGLS